MSISREHRMRVLENQARLAAARDMPARTTGEQIQMPLLVEVKLGPVPKRRTPRNSKPRAKQPGLGDL